MTRTRGFGAEHVASLLMFAACASAPAVAPGPVPIAARPQLSPALARDAAAKAKPATSVLKGDGGAVQPAPAPVPVERFPDTSFPPPSFEPMHARTARAADGKWSSVEEGRQHGGDVIAQATVHPHKFKKWVFVTAVAFDRRHTDLSLLAGTDEPVSEAVPKSRRPGLVPGKDHAALLSVFNGGFKVRHGDYGMMAGGDVYAPPIDDACTVALDESGELHIDSWAKLAKRDEKWAWYRQTPPCLVMDGKVNPRLKSEHRTRHWGAAVGGVYDIRRSAIGFDASGRSLIYAFGDWVTASDLARALAAIGVKRAAQLDINWSYTRFFLYEQKPGKGARIKRTLIPKLKFSRNRYVEKPSYRDFFYVTARP